MHLLSITALGDDEVRALGLVEPLLRLSLLAVPVLLVALLLLLLLAASLLLNEEEVQGTVGDERTRQNHVVSLFYMSKLQCEDTTC